MPGAEESNPTEALLQNLLKRPDVRSTLILSRKDGSIIKAAGLIAKDVDKQSLEPVRMATDPAEERTEEKTIGAEGKADSRLVPEVSRAQILASSIFRFVASATELSASLSKADTAGNAAISVNDSNAKDQQAGERSLSGSDIQLLRLRLSKQEVIIFPDPKYLCCVIQDLDKDSR